MARKFLSAVGIAYVGLGLWCAAMPRISSEAVGFKLQPGQGQSEFLTVYGGLEVSLGLVFLWPVCRREDLAIPLRTCLLIHAGLVVFRTLGFISYSGFETTTYALAATEWVIFVTATGLSISQRRSDGQPIE